MNAETPEEWGPGTTRPRQARRRFLAPMRHSVYRLGAGALAGFATAVAAHPGSITATVYVSRQFEVRDHDEPRKFVYNGATRVAEISGSLSDKPRLQRMRVVPGWNLLSLAVTTDDLLEQFEREQPGMVRSVWRWNPSSTNNYSQLTVAQHTPAGTVIWVRAESNMIFGVSGSYFSPSLEQVQPGDGYIGCSGFEAWSPAIPSAASSLAYDPQTALWVGHIGRPLGSLSDLPLRIAPGQAFYFQTDTAFDLGVPDPALSIRYYHEDHLGSSSVLTDNNGTLVEELVFYPFGSPRIEYRLRDLEAAYQFTQKERDRETCLNYFEARYTQSSLARFLIPDPKYANPESLSQTELSAWFSNPQSGNLYSYVHNNPVNSLDPTGLGPLDSLIYYDERKKASEKEKNPSPPPVKTRQKATFSDQPKRKLAATAMWRASLSAVCQEKAGSSDYKVLDSTMYGFDIDAGGNVKPFNPVGGSGIHVSSFTPYRGVKNGVPVGGVTIAADYTGSCEYSIRWVQTILTSSPHAGCGNIYNDPCVSDDSPGNDLPFYWTDKESPSHVQELDQTVDSVGKDVMRRLQGLTQ